MLSLCVGGAQAEPQVSDLPELRLTTGEWPPYTSAAMPQGGCLTPIVAESVRRMGYRPLGYGPETPSGSPGLVLIHG